MERASRLVRLVLDLREGEERVEGVLRTPSASDACLRSNASRGLPTTVEELRSMLGTWNDRFIVGVSEAFLLRSPPSRSFVPASPLPLLAPSLAVLGGLGSCPSPREKLEVPRPRRPTLAMLEEEEPEGVLA